MRTRPPAFSSWREVFRGLADIHHSWAERKLPTPSPRRVVGPAPRARAELLIFPGQGGSANPRKNHSDQSRDHQALLTIHHSVNSDARPSFSSRITQRLL